MTPGRGLVRRAAVLAVIAALGCSAEESPSTVARTSTPAGVTSRPPAPAPAPSAPGRTGAPSPTTITLAFAGDLNFDRQLAALLGHPGPLVTALHPLFADADVAMLNLETAITERGLPEPKAYHFRAPATALQVVASTGIDVVTMANNHAADYGPVGLGDTLAAKEQSPIPIVGLGHDAREAFAPAVLRRAGLSIAVLGSTEIDDLTLQRFAATDGTPGVATNLDSTRLVAAVRSASRRYDLVVVYLHWGLDYTACPDAVQPAMAARLAAAGADIVVGSHSHRVEAGGWLGDTYVDYGLGNFAWARNDGDNGVSGVLDLTVDVAAARRPTVTSAKNRPVVTAARWTPLLIGDDGVPRPPDTTTRRELLGRWVAGRDCADVTGHPG